MRLPLNLRHECGQWIWFCECGYTTAAIMIGSAIVSAASTAYGSYSAGQSGSAQARYAKAQAEQRSAAEIAAGEAEANAIGYSAGKAQRSFGSRAAVRGVQAHEGSLMEEEMAFASETDYEKQMARYRHLLASYGASYQANIFGSQAEAALRSGTTGAIVGAGTSLATGAARAYGMSAGGTGSGLGYGTADPLYSGYSEWGR
jgi:hypothetical protein